MVGVTGSERNGGRRRRARRRERPTLDKISAAFDPVKKRTNNTQCNTYKSFMYGEECSPYMKDL